MVKKMSKKVVILHGSPRVSGNSDILAKEFKKGSEDAGNEVKKISFPMRFINYCKGCLGVYLLENVLFMMICQGFWKIW